MAFASVSLTSLVYELEDAGDKEPASTAELLVSEACMDLPLFLATTRLGVDLRDLVHDCARERLLHAPAVSFAALSRARGTIEDFSRTYLPLHGLEPAAIVQFLPELLFVESAIYAVGSRTCESPPAHQGRPHARWTTSSSIAAFLCDLARADGRRE
jgi:hypothetical protein